MATWYAQNSTVNIDSVNEWNDVANGSGSWLTWPPAVGDTLHANGKTSIAVNVDVTCATITAVGGVGTFLINTNGVTIAANLIAGNAGTFLMNSGTPTVTVSGTVTGGGSYCIAQSVAGVLNITNNVTGGSASGGHGVYTTGTAGTITITGNLLGGSNSNAHAVNMTLANTLTVTGNVTAATGRGITSSHGSAVITVSAGNIVDTTTVSAIGVTSGFIYVPGATNYYRMRTVGAATLDHYYDVPSAANVRETDTVAGVTGTVLTKTLSAANETVDAGYYAATTLSTVDADLAAANIAVGTTIFGFAGSAVGGGAAVGPFESAPFR